MLTTSPVVRLAQVNALFVVPDEGKWDFVGPMTPHEVVVEMYLVGRALYLTILIVKNTRLAMEEAISG